MAFVLLVLAMSHATACNSISSASASDAGCGIISISGMVTLDPCNTLNTVSVDVFLEGCLVTSFALPAPCGNSFSGKSPSCAPFSPGTYTVEITAMMRPSGGLDANYAFITTVTVK
jgi:hypothetical protein